MDERLREKKRIRLREKLLVIGTFIYLGVWILSLVAFINIPALLHAMSSWLFVFLWLLGGPIVYVVVYSFYMMATLRRKHAWLSTYGSEVTATVTKHKVKRTHTPSGDPDSILCFQLSWSHPASKSRVSIWKRVPVGLEYERDSSGQEKLSDKCLQQLELFKPQAQLTVLCDPADPDFFLTLNPINPSRYPLPLAPGHFLEEALMTLGI